MSLLPESVWLPPGKYAIQFLVRNWGFNKLCLERFLSNFNTSCRHARKDEV